MKNNKDIYDKITSFFTVIVAVIALIVSIKSSSSQRNHDRLSVKPVLAFTFVKNPNPKHHSYHSIGLLLSNKGIGPAIIKEIIVELNNTDINVCKLNSWVNVEEKLGIEGLAQYFYYESGDPVKVDEKQYLIALRTDYETPPNRVRLLQALKRIKICVRYESIYQESFTLKYQPQ